MNITNPISQIENPAVSQQRNLTNKDNRLLSRLEWEKPSSLSEIKQSIAYTKSQLKGTPVDITSLSDNSRLNEQELYASIIHQSISKLGKKFLSTFENSFSKLIEQTGENQPRNSTVKYARSALNSLVESQLVSPAIARAIRRIALGRAQLDDDRTSLKTSRPEGAKETPLRSLKVAFEAYSNNTIASYEERQAFKRFVNGA